MRQYTALSAQTPRRKKSARLLALILVPFLLVAAMALSVAGGGSASAAAACQAIENGTTGGSPVTGPTGAVGQLSPLQVEQYWVRAGGPLSGAVTAAALASAESGDITDRLQGSSPSAPTVATSATPSDPSLVGWGLWQITPGSAADDNPAVNARIAVEKYRGSLGAGGGGWSPWTTYGTAAYYAAIPAAQAAYVQLTAQGGGGAAPAPTANITAPVADVVGAVHTTNGATGSTGAGGGSGSGGSSTTVDTSGLTAEQQAEIGNEAAAMQSSGDSSQCPNVSVSGALPTVPGKVATIQPSTGLAEAPTGLPPAVRTVIGKLIAAGNQIHTLPYIWGGGHSGSLSEIQAGYDCSGSTSYILYKAGLLAGAMVSGGFMTWGQPGPGKYVTIFSNDTHVFIEVDGIVLDTVWLAPVAPTSPGSGPRWQPSSMIQAQINSDIAAGNGGFTETHPPGL